jgi:hypothetical protein
LKAFNDPLPPLWSQKYTCHWCGTKGASCDSSGMSECDKCAAVSQKEWQSEYDAYLKTIPTVIIVKRPHFSFRKWIKSLWCITLPPLPKANKE